jgi:hypothetical protein
MHVRVGEPRQQEQSRAVDRQRRRVPQRGAGGGDLAVAHQHVDARLRRAAVAVDQGDVPYEERRSRAGGLRGGNHAAREESHRGDGENERAWCPHGAESIPRDRGFPTEVPPWIIRRWS